MCTESKNNDIPNIGTYAPGFQLLQFEALCHAELIRHLVRMFSKNEPSPRYGCQPGRNTYIALGYQLDAAVFLYESIKHFSLVAPQEVLQFQALPEYANLDVVRNNVHTYFKKGGFVKKVSSITTANLVEYKMIEPDFLYPFRSDISLVFEIVGKTRMLIGSDYFVQHCLFESAKKWSGPDYKNFSEFISASISSIAHTIDATAYRLAPLEFPVCMPNIELFDYKSANLYAASRLSQDITFRLMLMLFQISYGLILVEKIINSESVLQDDLWCCFFTKLLAIKYDESFDNLESILKFAKDDAKELNKHLNETDLEITNLKAREFAQKIRNTIHYQEIAFDSDLLSGATTRECVTAIYLSNVGLSNMSQFRDFSKYMVNEMKRLQVVIRKIMSVDKTYWI